MYCSLISQVPERKGRLQSIVQCKDRCLKGVQIIVDKV